MQLHWAGGSCVRDLTGKANRQNTRFSDGPRWGETETQEGFCHFGRRIWPHFHIHFSGLCPSCSLTGASAKVGLIRAEASYWTCMPFSPLKADWLLGGKNHPAKDANSREQSVHFSASHCFSAPLEHFALADMHMENKEESTKITQHSSHLKAGCALCKMPV